MQKELRQKWHFNELLFLVKMCVVKCIKYFTLFYGKLMFLTYQNFSLNKLCFNENIANKTNKIV